MKAEKNSIVVYFLIVILLIMNFVSFYGKDSEEPVSEITRVVSIYKDGKGGPEVLSLTPQGWLDFIRTYPRCVTISNLDEFEEMFNFEKVEHFFPEEAVAFLEREDLTIFDSWVHEKGFEDDMYCHTRLLSFFEYRSGITFRLSHPDLEEKVDFTIFDDFRPKRIIVYRDGLCYHYMVFDLNGKTMAISDHLEVFELTAK